MKEELRAPLSSAIQRMTETIGRAEGAARREDLHEARVLLAALEKDAEGSAQALAHALGPWMTSRRRERSWERLTGSRARTSVGS